MRFETENGRTFSNNDTVYTKPISISIYYNKFGMKTVNGKF